MARANLRFQSFWVRWAPSLALGAIASLTTFSSASAIPIRLEVNTYPSRGQSVYRQPVYSQPVYSQPGYGQPVYGTTVYGVQTSYPSSYRSGGFGITIGGYSREYPYTHPAYSPPGYPSNSVIFQPGYTPYSPGLNNSVLVSPTVVDSQIYNPTLINPRIIDRSRYPRRSRHRNTTTIIRYQVPFGASGITVPLNPYPYRTYPYFQR